MTVVEAPVTRAYNQWTQFETFPAFMAGVERVSQLTPTRTHWEINIGGVRREFDAEITEQHPDERVAWRSVEGPEHGGVVTFHRLDDHTTRVHLQMQYHPETLTEKAGTALGAVGTIEHRSIAERARRWSPALRACEEMLMTGPSDFDIEAPVPDAVDQRREEAPPTEPGLEPIEQIPDEANEADVVEQHQVVPVDDEPMD